MSFSFTAVGRKDDVVRQLRAIKDGTAGTGELAPEIAQLLARHIDTDHLSFAGDYDCHYVVSASGHSGGGSATSLQLTVTPHYIRKVEEEVMEMTAEQTEAAEAEETGTEAGDEQAEDTTAGDDDDE